jgi:dUTP pyrophosphatase
MSDNLLVKRLSEFAIIPSRGSQYAAGFDLHSARSMIIPAFGKGICPTDLSISCPIGTYGRIAPRSSLACKYHIDVGAGVIDSDYRGPVDIVLFNHSGTDFNIKEGDRIAQLILEKIKVIQIIEVSELDKTGRGSGGFGSTGI